MKTYIEIRDITPTTGKPLQAFFHITRTGVDIAGLIFELAALNGTDPANIRAYVWTAKEFNTRRAQYLESIE